jgi:hypothetical protein
MFQARIEAGEFREVVKTALVYPAEDRVDGVLQLDEVHEKAVLVELAALESHLEAIAMGMRAVLVAPVAPDEEMLGDEVALKAQAVHVHLSATHTSG